MTSPTLGVILYGPPAAGKDTATEALHALDPRYVLFPRLKIGPGRTTGYRMTDPAAVQALQARGDVIWQNHRYGAIYLIDRPALLERLHDHIPVLHVGQREAIDAVVAAIPDTLWLVAALWCPRDVAEQRLNARPTQDTTERLHVWDDTPPLDGAIPAIDTAEHSPDDIARLLHQQIAARLLAAYT